MRGPSLVGYEPLNVRWSGDSERIYFQWKQSTDPIAKDPDTYVVTRSGSAPQKLSDAEAKLAPPAFGDLSKDRKRIVYARDGDIFVYDNNKGQTRQITQTQDSESSPRWLPDGKRVYFTRSNNLYVMSLDNGSLAEMTDIRLPGAAAPSDEEKKGTDSQEYLKKEEKSLLEVVRERAAKREEDEARRKRENPRKPFSLQARQSVVDLRLSPDEKYVTAVIDETGEKTKKTTVANFVTESAYTEDTPSRDKVGDIQTRNR
jgi:dipeptidyl aminopeptidase/acylaminoacyl peptidase